MIDLTKMTRDQVVPHYVDLIKEWLHINAFSDEVKQFNEAIIARWSKSALTYIKDKAWKVAFPKN